MKHKILALMVLMLACCSIFAVAEGNDTNEGNNVTDNGSAVGTSNSHASQEVTYEDENETTMMHTPRGTTVRLLQLQKVIKRNLLAGEDVIAAIQGLNSSADVSELEEILTNLSAVLDRVKAMDLTGNASELAAGFVEIKSEARGLTQDFRQAAKPFFTEDSAKQLRELIRSKEKTRLKDLYDGIEKAKKEYNAEKLGMLLNRLGITDQGLIDGIKDGNITIGHARTQVVKATKELSTQEKHQALLKLKEDRVKQNVFMSHAAERAKEMVQERILSARGNASRGKRK